MITLDDAPPAIAPLADTASHAIATSPNTRTVAAPHEVLVFELGSETYAIDILEVQEIRSSVVPTRLAGAPASVQGLIDLRGTIVPIVDLRHLLALPKGNDGASATVIMNLQGWVVGIVVDAVAEVLRPDPARLRPAPVFDASIDTAYVAGLLTTDDDASARLLILVDVARLLRDIRADIAA